jgi:hypothetical protein
VTLGNNVISVFFALAGVIEIGRLLGKGLKNVVPKMAYATLLTSVSAGSVLPVICASYPRVLQLASNSGMPLTQEFQIVAILVCLNAILEVIRANFAMPLRRLGEGGRSTLVSTGALLTGFVIAALLGLVADMGATGIVLGQTIGLVLANCILGVIWFYTLQKYHDAPVVVETIPQPRPTSYVERLTRYFIGPSSDRGAQSPEIPETELSAREQMRMSSNV